MSEEIWKDIEGFEGLYQVSNQGRIKSLKRWNGHQYVNEVRILKGHINRPSKKCSYARKKVTLSKDKKKYEFPVHRLVANAFVHNPYGYEIVNHIDSDPLNNHADNLEWCTHEMNMKHSVEFGNRKTLRKEVSKERLLELLNSELGFTEIAFKLDIAVGSIYKLMKEYGIQKVYI